MSTADYNIAEIQVQPDHGRLISPNGAANLEPRVMDTLVCLLKHQNQVVTKETLVAEVWDGRAISDEAISQAIFGLRKALKQIGCNSLEVQTLRKRGYRLKTASDPTISEPNGATSLQHATAKQSTLLSHWPVWAGLAIAMVVVSIVVTSRIANNTEDRLAFLPDQSAPVLEIQPFLLPDASSPPEYLQAAFLYALEAELGQQPDIVLADTLPAPGNGNEKHSVDFDQRQVLQLGFAGESGGLSVQVEVKDSKRPPIWNAPADGPVTLDNFNAVAKQIAQTTLSNLGVSYSDRQTCPLPNDPTVLASWFEASRLISLRGEQNIRIAIQHYNRILERQPTFHGAWSDLAHAYQILPVYVADALAPQERARTDPMAQAAAKKALEYCAVDAQAYQIAGYTPEYNGSNHWIRNEYRMRRALSMDSNDAETLRHYADMLKRVGYLEDAKRVLHHALRVAPLHARIQLEAAVIDLDTENLSAAKQRIEHARKLGSNLAWPMMEHAHALVAGDWTTAFSLIDDFPPQTREIMRIVTQVWSNDGNNQVQQQAATRLREILSEGHLEQAGMVHLAALLIGAPELAFDAYDLMRKDDYNLHPFWMPPAHAFRMHPRFSELTKSMGLHEYWQYFGDPDRCRLRADTLICFQ